jgi:lipopolysaccharide export system permease protein
LVLRSFIGPFIATFFLTLFVLILQFFWLWIDDFVGKGIDTYTMLRLVLYLSATLVPLALPLAILLSSIMTFGNLGETFELVAIKSAGIGLLRFMLPLTVVAALLSGMAFLFNNYVIPVANLRMKTLHYDLVNKKPAFDLKEGVFYTTIPDYAIKVSKKEKDSILHNVVIYESSTGPQDNIVAAEKGIMRISADKRFLEFTLYNGWRYEERGNRYGNNTDFIRLGFKEYKKVLDLSSLALTRTNDSTYKDRYEMLSTRQLSKNVDSLQKSLDKFKERDTRELQAYLAITKYFDTGWVDVKAPPIKKGAKTFLDLLPDSLKVHPTDAAETGVKQRVLDETNAYAGYTKNNIEGPSWDYDGKRKELRLTLMTYHEKITMSIAVLVLFLIGAPLGSIVRKGGIGTPVVFAVVFFVIFFLLNNFGKKFVKEDVLQPAAGMWLATAVLLPIGLFLIYKALHDSQLFNKEFYYRAFRAIRKLMAKKNAGVKEAATAG